MAFVVGLPIIVIRPHKFALCFTVGSILYMSSFGLLKGPMAHILSMLAIDQLPFTISYVASMLATLYAALIARSYVLVVVSSSLQLLALAYYMLSFIPGGTAGARIFSAMFFRGAMFTITTSLNLMRACFKMAI